MRKKRRGPYHFIVTLPDRLYPFGAEIEGEWVRGRRSYEFALRSAFRKYGRGHYGFGLAFYRSLFHILGSVAIIVLSGIVSRDLFGSDIALYVVLTLTALFIAFQEFYLQRGIESPKKAITDWFAWVSPMLLYIFFH